MLAHDSKCVSDVAVMCTSAKRIRKAQWNLSRGDSEAALSLFRLVLGGRRLV